MHGYTKICETTVPFQYYKDEARADINFGCDINPAPINTTMFGREIPINKNSFQISITSSSTNMYAMFSYAGDIYSEAYNCMSGIIGSISNFRGQIVLFDYNKSSIVVNGDTYNFDFSTTNSSVTVSVYRPNNNIDINDFSLYNYTKISTSSTSVQDFNSKLTPINWIYDKEKPSPEPLPGALTAFVAFPNYSYYIDPSSLDPPPPGTFLPDKSVNILPNDSSVIGERNYTLSADGIISGPDITRTAVLIKPVKINTNSQYIEGDIYRFIIPKNPVPYSNINITVDVYRPNNVVQ